MKLSKRGEYALRALIDFGIAHELGRPLLKIGELVEKERLPVKFLEQILTQLRGAGYLKTTILYPGSDLPQARVFLETGGLLDYMHIHLVARDGHAYDGTRVVEDSFHIVIQDASGNFHSFSKRDLKEFEKQPGKSVMPSFKDKLSAAQVDDLVAYLASLKGAP